MTDRAGGWRVDSAMMLRTIVCALLACSAVAEAAPPSRADFAKRLASLKVGSAAADAKKLLGPPDDVRGELDPGGIPTSRTREIWRFGTARHLGMATLGLVYIDEHDLVQYIYGGRGTPPAGFDESELRRLLTILDHTPSYSAGWSFDPRALIRSVNALQPLGKDRALAVIGEYLRVTSEFDDAGRQGMFLVLRALFDAPGDAYPVMAVGGPSPPAPTDPKVAPRFPLVILHDVPLCLVSGYMLAGMAERPEDDLSWFAQHGKLRAQPLKPTDQPLAVAAELAAMSAKWWPAGAGPDSTMLRNQLLLLVDSIQRADPDVYGLRFPSGKDADARWKALMAHFPAVKWDAQTQKYLRPDGSALPDLPEVISPRVVWRPKFAAGSFALDRQSPRFVRLEWRIAAAKTAVPALAVRVFINDAAAPLTKLASTGTAVGSEQVTSTVLTVPAGSKLRITVSAGASQETSPKLAP